MLGSDDSNRRPLAVRNTAITKKISIYLNNKAITPNQISIMSIVFAIAGLLACSFYFQSHNSLWLLSFALMIQMRLLCNLFDGMVAIEGGKKTPAGELFNDVPDRIADPLLILAAGLLTSSQWGMTLAWLAAIFSIFTAYIRVLGVSMGCPADFSGPMAKQHRMALLTGSAILLFILSWWQVMPSITDYLFDVSLAVMVVGCIFTCWRRLSFIYSYKSASLAEGTLHD
ncbi:CDP-alcohol phosphatidyltransferase family protein [Vibrio hyugaensis]|nr:CDP-alcohol phosphatidyltransferase family protein [Vibrio hyugaensis]